MVKKKTGAVEAAEAVEVQVGRVKLNSLKDLVGCRIVSVTKDVTIVLELDEGKVIIYNSGDCEMSVSVEETVEVKTMQKIFRELE